MEVILEPLSSKQLFYSLVLLSGSLMLAVSVYLSFLHAKAARDANIFGEKLFDFLKTSSFQFGILSVGIGGAVLTYLIQQQYQDGIDLSKDKTDTIGKIRYRFDLASAEYEANILPFSDIIDNKTGGFAGI